MEKESDPKLYEIYYLTKAESEEQAISVASSITDAVEKERGITASQIHPSRKVFSYPLGKEKEGWWGTVRFMLKPDGMPSLEEKIKNIPQIIRFSIFRIAKADTMERPRRKPRVATEKPKEKTDIAEIDKKLEEMLGS